MTHCVTHSNAYSIGASAVQILHISKISIQSLSDVVFFIDMATPKNNEKEPLLQLQAFSFSSNTLAVTEGHVNSMFIMFILQGFSEP